MARRSKRIPRVLRGYVDHFLRPIVSIPVIGHEDPLMALIDTGFNAGIALSPFHALALGIRISTAEQEIETATTLTHVRFGDLRIRWFGVERLVQALVFKEQRSQRFSDPIALLGAGLLRDRSLSINYTKRTVLIR